MSSGSAVLDDAQANPIEQLPVLVVGAGPVGQTVAALLTQWGVDVRLFDARDERDAIGSKAICQARDVLDVWEHIGAGRAIAEAGVTWTTARTFYREREISCWEFEDRGRSVFPPFVNLGQQQTEEELDAALEKLGVTTTWGHRLTCLENEDNRVRVTFETMTGSVRVDGSYVVLATGARSDEARQMLSLSFDGKTFDDQFLICDIKTELPGWETERRFYFDPPWNPGRQVLIHACPDSTYRIDWQVPADYDLAADETSGGLNARIRHIIGARDYEIVWKSVYRFHSRHVGRMVVGRTLLAGDVAHLVSPFGARGLNTGVFDAENAAWKVAYLVKGWGGPRLLGSYDQERLAATRENIEVTSATMEFLVPQTESERQERLRILESAAGSTEPVDIDSGRFAEPFWYLASPLTTPDATRPFGGRPAKGRTPTPAPGVVVPDVAVSSDTVPGCTRIREVLRQGFTILVAAGTDLTPALRAAKEATHSAVRVVRLDDLGDGGELAAVLGVRSGEAWIVRPDAYVAAVADAGDETALVAALRRAFGH